MIFFGKAGGDSYLRINQLSSLGHGIPGRAKKRPPPLREAAQKKILN
jgi:hypothetical protein